MAKKSKLNLINDNLTWSADRRYKVNSVVHFNGVDYQNITGKNSSPDLLVDWQKSTSESSNYNSDDILNVSTVVGVNVTDALNNLKNAIPETYTQIVYVNSTSPSTATIFDTINPPTTNNNALKNDVTNLYVGTDISTWVYQTSPAGYVTKTITATTSNFYLEGTSTDAGSNKTADIERVGKIKSTGFKVSGTTGLLKSDGTVDTTNYERVSNKNQSNGYPGLESDGKILATQLPLSKVKNASNVDQFMYALDQGFQITGAGDTSVSFDSTNKRITITSIPGAGGGGAVTSFNGRTGGVVATEGDYSLNLLGDVTISSLVDKSILLYNSANTLWENKLLNTSIIPELTNLYYTNARAIGSVLTGYISSPGTVSATDTILQAFNKVNGNIALKADISQLHNPLTLGTANGLSLATQVLSLGLAGSGSTGALSSTDWNTFNGKFPTPTGLTTNYLPKWNGSGFSDSSVSQDASGNVNINGGSGNDVLFLNKSTGASFAMSGNNGASGKIVFQASNNANPDLQFFVGGVFRYTMTSGGKFLVNTQTDDLTNQLQVNGTISASPAVNSNQVVVKSQLDAFVPSGTVNLTGDQSITGQKTFNNTTASNSIFNTNNGTGSGIRVDNSATGTGHGILVNNNGTNNGVSVQNNSTGGNGLSVQNNSTGSGSGLRVINVSAGTGVGVLVTSGTSNTGFNYVGQNNGATTFSVNKTGDITANKLIIPDAVNANEAVNKGQLDATAGVSGIWTPTSSGFFTYLKSYYEKKGNLLKLKINAIINVTAANISGTGGITLPNSYTTSNSLFGRCIGTSVVTRGSNSETASLVAKEANNNTTIDFNWGGSGLTTGDHFVSIDVIIEVN